MNLETDFMDRLLQLDATSVQFKHLRRYADTQTRGQQIRVVPSSPANLQINSALVEENSIFYVTGELSQPLRLDFMAVKTKALKVHFDVVTNGHELRVGNGLSSVPVVRAFDNLHYLLLSVADDLDGAIAQDNIDRLRSTGISAGSILRGQPVRIANNMMVATHYDDNFAHPHQLGISETTCTAGMACSAILGGNFAEITYGYTPGPLYLGAPGAARPSQSPPPPQVGRTYIVLGNAEGGTEIFISTALRATFTSTT